MHKRTLNWDWQKQQYFSQVHSVSGLSHSEQRVITSLLLQGPGAP